MQNIISNALNALSEEGELVIQGRYVNDEGQKPVSYTHLDVYKRQLMGLIISGAEPVYLTPELSKEWGVQGGITPEDVEKMFQVHPDCKGVMVVSPTYLSLIHI